MARMIFLSAPHPALGHLFTIDHAVGLNGANHRNDVLLVQFFLRALIPTPPGAPTIPFDGHCGRQTINWIRYFQAADCDDGPGVREAGQRGGDQNNLKQIGLAAHNSDGSVRFIGGQNNLKQIGLATHTPTGPFDSSAAADRPSCRPCRTEPPTRSSSEARPERRIYRTAPPIRLSSASSPRQTPIRTFISTTEPFARPTTASRSTPE